MDQMVGSRRFPGATILGGVLENLSCQLSLYSRRQVAYILMPCVWTVYEMAGPELPDVFDVAASLVLTVAAAAFRVVAASLKPAVAAVAASPSRASRRLAPSFWTSFPIVFLPHLLFVPQAVQQSIADCDDDAIVAEASMVAQKIAEVPRAAEATTMAQRTAEVPQVPSMAEFEDVHIVLQWQRRWHRELWKYRRCRPSLKITRATCSCTAKR